VVPVVLPTKYEEVLVGSTRWVSPIATKYTVEVVEMEVVEMEVVEMEVVEVEFDPVG
jgi:hypothetical protein